MSDISGNIDVLVLCGGLGTRLREVVSDRPKAMATVNDRPFLDILINQFKEAGFRRFILCTGYMSDAIKRYYTDNRDDVDVLFSEESEPLGTGGAVKNAQLFIQSDPFFVVNGDSYCSVDLQAFKQFHNNYKAILSMVVTRVTESRDYGLVKVNDQNRISGFAEKQPNSGPGFINAGIYLFNRTLLGRIPDDIKSSLETDLFPRLTNQRTFAYIQHNPILDIGTPERLKKANAYFEVT